ncbi:hypothetical protein NEOLEDRAFT_1180623 [Neolentinus lepideus HHB14362 ss-1]|uniref:P-loop containing nucleoside triphosphate hydrolase protein n=1 Tax=Neolentinus lepideus HHB14362 ss-1 TaxID=1314782 RepID=A0A165QU88_9AGAM|nr:hypothetical protein NEOLEDRAFT_1180623 [Neolentinus lepideus HHB14362 ss-1]
MGNATALELSSSGYALRRKELLQLVKQLRAIGAQAELDLPCVAVIGNQSAGKSSVVEAISGIKVPRDAGTCTRCPMECRLSSSEGPWTCQISIRWEFDDKGKRKDDVQEVAFGAPITNKGVVELALRRAQAAVLNPSIPLSKFLIMTAEDLKDKSHVSGTLKFSRNVVCVDLVGPDLTDLSFIDLPGIIQNAEPETVQLVEDLVISHIKGNCLILVALPMTDDIENQKALRLAHGVDPKGLRTIGVLTKPDMLTSGATKARDLWLDVIEGRRHSLLHGYYCTRQPDDVERANDISAASARQAETEFFANTAPWSRSTQKNRFGTINLLILLPMLTFLIRLPALDIEAKSCLQACDEELMTLPQPIEAEPATYVLGLITTFATEFQRYVQGGVDSGRLIHENHDAYRNFKYSIRRTAPNFVPYPGASSAVQGEFENFIGDGEDGGPVEGLVSAKAPVYLSDMRQHIERSITRELPDDVPFPCKVSLIQAFQTTWNPSAMECFESAQRSMVNLLHDLLCAYFSRYEPLHKQLRLFTTELVSRHQAICTERIEEILEIESEPFTQNGHYYDSCRDKWLAKYKDARAGKTFLSEERPVKVAKTSRTADVSQTQARPVSGSNAHASSASSAEPVPSPVSASPPSGSSAQFVASLPTETNKVPFGFSSSSGAGAFTFAKPSTGFRQPPMGFVEPPTGFGQPTTGFVQSPTGFGQPTTGFVQSPTGFGQPSTGFGLPSADTRKTNATPPLWPTRSIICGFDNERDTQILGIDPSHVAPSRPTLWAVANSKQASEANFSTAAPKPSLSEVDEEKINAALAALADIGYAGLTAEDLGKLNPPDEFTREIIVMAQVRAYFQVSYKRVIDNVPLLIDRKFVRAIAKDLQGFLISKLGLGTANASSRCAAYLAEDPNIIVRRDELIARKKRLEGVKLELAKFGL